MSKQWCEHHYESDCHGIDMLKSPDGSGKDLCAGGTAHPSRFHFCPWCGKPRPTEPKQPTLAEKLAKVWRDMPATADADYWESAAKTATTHFTELSNEEIRQISSRGSPGLLMDDVEYVLNWLLTNKGAK